VLLSQFETCASLNHETDLLNAGWVGDGVNSCDINSYLSVFSLVKFGVTEATLDLDFLKTSVIDDLVLEDSEFPFDRFYVSTRPFYGETPSARRELTTTSTGI
jgi:hypothetical protein